MALQTYFHEPFFSFDDVNRLFDEAFGVFDAPAERRSSRRRGNGQVERSRSFAPRYAFWHYSTCYYDEANNWIGLTYMSLRRITSWLRHSSSLVWRRRTSPSTSRTAGLLSPAKRNTPTKRRKTAMSWRSAGLASSPELCLSRRVRSPRTSKRQWSTASWLSHTRSLLQSSKQNGLRYPEM